MGVQIRLLVHIFTAAFDWRILPPYQKYAGVVWSGARFRGYTGRDRNAPSLTQTIIVQN